MEGSDPIQHRSSTLQRSILVALIMGLLFYLGYALAEGTANARFLQVGAAVGVLVYLATFVDALLGIAILIVCIGLGPEVSWGGLGDLRLEDFVVPALLLSWLTRSGQRRDPMLPSPVGRPATLYYVAMLVSALAGVAAGTTTLPRALVLLGKYLEYYVIFLIVLNNVRTREELRGMAVFAFLVATTSALASLGRTFDAGPAASKLQGPLGETGNIYGGYLVLHMAVGMGLLMEVRGGGARLGLAAGVLAMGTALLNTLSRTSYVAIAGALLFFGILRDRRVLLFLLGFVLLLPTLPELVLTRMDTIRHVVQPGAYNASWDARVTSWHAVLERLSGPEFLLGRGPGSVNLGDVDSEYFRVLSDTGFLGLALFITVLVGLFRLAIRTYDRLGRGTFEKGYAGGFLIAFVALCIHGVAATSFTSIRSMQGLVVLAGLFACLAHRLEEWDLAPRRHERPLPGPGLR